MLVTNVEISQVHYCAASNRQTANVCLTAGDRFVSLLCKIPADVGQSTNARVAALMREAKRQILRMPEFRSGEAELSFARDAFSAPPALA